MQRIAIIGEGPAALSTAEKLISAGMCVDLITPNAPHHSVYSAALLASQAYFPTPSQDPTAAPAPLPACALSATCG